MTTKNINHNLRSELTKPETYKRYNVSMLDAYNALYPPLLAKLSITIFNAIMQSKLHRQQTARDFSRNEDKRIFNNSFLQLEDILDRYNPQKYKLEGKLMKNDLSNLMGRLQELDDNNIFYIWKYGKPITYLFVMERDIGIWKYYNVDGCVTPKTLKKIVALSNSMIDSMVSFEKKRGRPVQLKDVEISFVGDFIPHMISKMNPNVANRIPKRDKGDNISDYLTLLRETLNKMEDYEGLKEDLLFHKRLPNNLADKLKQEKGKKSEMNTEQLTNDLVPKNDDLVGSKITKTRKRSPSIKDSIQPKHMSFADLNPFDNCNKFLKFYRECIRMYNNNARFYPAQSERSTSAQILDMLIQSGKGGDIDFLRSWIRHYINSYLQGNNVYKEDKTSLSSFKKTFKSYEDKHFRA